MPAKAIATTKYIWRPVKKSIRFLFVINFHLRNRNSTFGYYDSFSRIIDNHIARRVIYYMFKHSPLPKIKMPGFLGPGIMFGYSTVMPLVFALPDLFMPAHLLNIGILTITVNLVGLGGLEPSTSELKAPCSTN